MFYPGICHKLSSLWIRFIIRISSMWILLFRVCLNFPFSCLTMWLVSMNHKFHLLNYYLSTKVCTEIHIHHQTSEEWLNIQKSVLLYTWHLSQFETIGQAQKSIKQFPCMVIMGNRGMWFGTIFPYMVDGGKWWCTLWHHISLYDNGGN